MAGYVHSGNELQTLLDFLKTRWKPCGMASDYLGRHLELDSPRATHYSIGGGLQFLFKNAAHQSATNLSVTCDALYDRAVLGWEQDRGRTFAEVAHLIEVASIARAKGLTHQIGQFTQHGTSTTQRTRAIADVRRISEALLAKTEFLAVAA